MSLLTTELLVVFNVIQELAEWCPHKDCYVHVSLREDKSIFTPEGKISNIVIRWHWEMDDQLHQFKRVISLLELQQCSSDKNYLNYLKLDCTVKMQRKN